MRAELIGALPEKRWSVAKRSKRQRSGDSLHKVPGNLAGRRQQPEIIMDEPRRTQVNNTAKPAPQATPVQDVAPTARAPATPAGSESMKQQQQSLSTVDPLDNRWKQLVGAAKATWDKLTVDELFKCEGNEQKLCDLVQRRYAITGAEADRQVRKFFAKQS